MHLSKVNQFKASETILLAATTPFKIIPRYIVFNPFLPAKPRSVNVAAQTPANIKLFILGRTSRGEGGGGGG